jgi:two-component system, NarL family, sensor histidine kinase EvgS
LVQLRTHDSALAQGLFLMAVGVTHKRPAHWLLLTLACVLALLAPAWAWAQTAAAPPASGAGAASTPALSAAPAPGALANLIDALMPDGRALRVGLLANFQPYQLWPEGASSPAGADVELLGALSQSTGQQWQLLRYTDVQKLEKDLAEGRIDLVMSMARTPERLKRFVFSSPYATVEQGLIARVETTSAAVSADLAGRVVAVVKNSAVADIVAGNFPLAKRIEFDSIEQAVNAVAQSKADLVLEALPALQQAIERQQINGLRVLRSFKFDEGRLRLAARSSDEALITKLNAALESIPPSQQAEYERRWSVVPKLTKRPERFVLSEAERKRVAQIAPLRVGYVRTDRPFSFTNEAGEPAGLSIELLRDLRLRTGVRVDSIWGGNVAEVLEAMASGKLDLVVGLTETSQRRHLAVFVGPYLTYPLALLAKTGSGYLSLEDLSGRTLAMAPGYFANDSIQARYPSIKFVNCGPDNNCMDAVANGQADATVSNLLSASTRIAQRGGVGAGVQVVGAVPDIFDQHSIALRPGLASFAPLLKRALDDAMATDLPVLQRKWLLPKVQTGVDPKLVQRGLMAGAAVIFALLLGWLLHTRSLAREVSARREAQGRAEQASHERQRYLAFLAHEVRNSLNAVIGGISLLRQRYGHGAGSVAAGAPSPGLVAASRTVPAVDEPAVPGRVSAPALLGLVDSSARSTLGLLNDLLDYHRIDAGRLAIELRPARLAEVARAVVSEMQPAALDKGLSLGLETSGDLQAWHRMDTVRVGQVLRNLVANAIKFTATGRVHVRVHVGPRLSVAVQDSGIGIAPELHQRLFEPFQQAPGHGDKGTGLGLALSRELMRAMGGDISLHSQAGAGALFTAEWPAVPVPADETERMLESTATTRAASRGMAADAAAPDHQPSHQQDRQHDRQPSRQPHLRTALVVEDSPVYAITMQALLIKQGWQVRTASTVDAALQEFDNLAPHLLVCDLHLPDGSAFDLLTRIAATRRAAKLTLEVVVMTSAPDALDVEELRQCGADRVIEKSFDPAEMTRRVFEPA